VAILLIMSELEKSEEKSFDFAQDLVKQIITLSTGVIALSITFSKDFATTAPRGARTLLAVSWIGYIAAIALGIWTLMAMTGSLHDGKKSINDSNIRVPAGLHFICFLAALVLTIIAGWKAL
jgi:hypothetical protein